MAFREESEDIDTLVSEFKMDKHAIVLVEGETDVLLYEKFIDTTMCRLYPLQGKEKVIEIINSINEEGIERVCAIIDADLDYITREQYTNNIFITDGHDAEIMMFLSDAFVSVIKEYYQSKYCSENSVIIKTREKLILLALPLAYMRLLSKDLSFNFAFKPVEETSKSFPYGKFIEVNNKKIEHLTISKLIQTVCSYNNNQGAGKDQKQMEVQLTELMKKKYEEKQILHGHDLMNIIALSLKYYGKSNKKNKVADDIETAFRLAYSIDYFKTTTLYSALELYSKKIDIPILRT